MQVEENVNISNFLPIGNKAGSGNNTSKADKKNEQLNFSGFLVSAGSNNKNDSSVTSRTNAFCDAANSKDVELSDETTLSDNEDNLKLTDSVEKTNNQNQTDDVETDSQLSTEKTKDDQEMVLATLSSIIQMVMEQFQLLPEELTAQLNEFGMELKDLGTKEGIKEFFLSMESADFSDLLINETLNQELHTFTEDFLQLLDQGGLTEEKLESVLPEIDVAGLLAESTELQDPVAEETSEQSESRLGLSEEITGEPEVLISGQETKTTKNMEKQPDSQKEDGSSEMPEQEMELAKDTSVARGEKFENPILQAIDDAINRVQENVTVEETVPENDIIKQIVEQVRISMNQDSTSMELQLYPEHLGKIQINVVSKDGVMTARISAETEAARQAIEGGLSSLKDSLEQQNLKVEAIEVMVSTTGFEQQNEEQNSYQQKNDSKSTRKLDLSGIDDDIPADDEGEAIRMMAAGSSVSYTA